MDSIMKIKNFENGLAFIGAILIFVGVGAAASAALAGEIGAVKIYYSAQK